MKTVLKMGTMITAVLLMLTVMASAGTAERIDLNDPQEVAFDTYLTNLETYVLELPSEAFVKPNYQKVLLNKIDATHKVLLTKGADNGFAEKYANDLKVHLEEWVLPEYQPDENTLFAGTAAWVCTYDEETGYEICHLCFPDRFLGRLICIGYIWNVPPEFQDPPY